MLRLSSSALGAVLVGGAVLLAGCSSIPTSGPSRSQIVNASQTPSAVGIQIVDVTDEVARKL
jgi:polysaccharide biosynthesis/export protein